MPGTEPPNIPENGEEEYYDKKDFICLLQFSFFAVGARRHAAVLAEESGKRINSGKTAAQSDFRYGQL